MKYYRKETDIIQDTPARELSAIIIESLSLLTNLEGDEYYEVEDELTEIINNYFKSEEKIK